jgi:hypothetical protein
MIHAPGKNNLTAKAQRAQGKAIAKHSTCYAGPICIHLRKKAFAAEDTEEDALDWFCSVTSVPSVAGSFVSIEGPWTGLPPLALTGHV